MQIKNYKNLNNLINFDKISKYNLLNIKEKNIINKINFHILLESSNNNFLNNFFIISNLIMELFNQKIFIFKIKKEVFKGGKYKNNVIFNIGITLKRQNIYLYFNYFKNIIFLMSKQIDNNIIKKKTKFGFIYKFSNINYLLGLIDSSNKYYYKFNFIYNINIILKKKEKKNYEKFFL